MKEHIWDVIIIGGGPAGMMAAGRAAERGHRVLLLEKNSKLGEKLLITGGGRCNVTNNKPHIRTLAEKYKGNAKFLFSAFSQFGVTETLEFFHSRGMPTKEENEGRIFPVSNTALSVWSVLLGYMKENNVKVRTGTPVQNILYEKEKSLFTVFLKDKKKFEARSCIIATGGVSHPETGSTGDGFYWLDQFGHTIIDNDFALVPIALKDSWVKNISGRSIDNIKITAFQNNKKQVSAKGKILFTHFGISGPTVLNMSKAIGDILPYGDVVLSLDLFPHLDESALKAQIQSHLIGESNKMIKNTLPVCIPSALVPIVLSIANISKDTYNHSVTREERVRLVKVCKDIPMHVKSLLGAEKAIVSSGGVSLEEVNFQTMESRRVPGLYIVGDVLNIDRPSGGYSLQLCWTTGFIAGNSCQ